ncbi:uncharacterized protein LOC131008309 [Salvia miltiorrhiza]|uniref:uncharacterized protein LOC131008309 n=1 Tax=Salvia miltiorrhiza TaxID=226208 RepID=UPI0025AC79BF|nr:uncharacterized protein LOC131008309 [Salvia miltiorrhiza]
MPPVNVAIDWQTFAGRYRRQLSSVISATGNVHRTAVATLAAAVSVDDGEHEPWDFCGVYGWSNTEDHYLTWDLMISLLPSVSNKWICGGDFNQTMYHFEKRDGNMKSDYKLVKFRETIETCGLLDLGFVGEPFTWTNNQRGEDNIMERLDRIFGSEGWIAAFPGFEVSHLLRKSSDHCPILLARWWFD